MKGSRVTFAGVIAWIPMAMFLVPIGFAFTCYLYFGGWPRAHNPDPKVLELPFFHAAALLSYPVAFLSLVAGLIWLIGAYQQWKKHQAISFLLGLSFWGLSIGHTAPLLAWLVD